MIFARTNTGNVQDIMQAPISLESSWQRPPPIPFLCRRVWRCLILPQASSLPRFQASKTATIFTSIENANASICRVGRGFIAAFQMTDLEHYRLLAKVPTAIGAKTAGYYGKQGKGFDRFYLAVPARGGQSAEVRIYTVQD
jgi:hypothetical protein